MKVKFDVVLCRPPYSSCRTPQTKRELMGVRYAVQGVDSSETLDELAPASATLDDLAPADETRHDLAAANDGALVLQPAVAKRARYT